jgi:TolB-like protein/DNA-binding winged helix-turn-helix (wHTH) protein
MGHVGEPFLPLQPAKVQDSVKFGDGFDLDLGAGRLTRSGRVLKLERIPMEILLLLVQQRGELVTREQIVERVWGKDIYLDTDNSINGAIRKVRQVLKDDPEQARFIQTISGKGYRFIAPITDPGAEPQVSTPTPAAEPTAVQDSGGWRRRRRRLWIVVASAVVFLIGATAYFRWTSSEAKLPRTHGRTMLAVLPFENLTGDAHQEYFSDGMTEEMITRLGSLDPDHLGIIARTSVMHYKHSQEQLRQIANELGVQYVLEGSVMRDTDKVRITAQLIQMKDQTHIWARQYDRQLKDLLTVQNEIAQEISDEIQTSLGDRKSNAPAAQPALSPQEYEAYNLYLEGQYFWNKRTVSGFQQAINYFQQATAKDPNYARAYAGLADTYALMAGYTGTQASEFVPKARAAALRALQLDDRLPEAHAALALIVQNHDYDWQTAEREFKRAIALNPNYATAHQWYAEHLAWRGRFDEALQESERARELDPLSLIIASDNGATLYYARQFDRAIAQLAKVREMDPDFPRASIILEAYLQKGMLGEAMAGFKKMPSGNWPWYWSNAAYVYGRTGHASEADQALRKLLVITRQQPVDSIVVVQAYVGVGNNDQALVWLEKAYAEHSNGLTALRVDPIYDPLRNDPRFRDILRRAGLAQ